MSLKDNENEKQTIMKNANEIVRILMDSPKWCAYIVGEYPNEYAHFVYAQELAYCKMFKLSIPLAPGNERRPDPKQDWVIRILIEGFGALVYVHVPKEYTKTFDGFIHFLKKTIDDCNNENIMAGYVPN